MLKPLTCAAILAVASTTALASGPSAADVALFSAQLARMPDLDEIHREQASGEIRGGDIRGFTEAMRRVVDVATTVAVRDYPQLGAGWRACLAYLVTTDGGLTYQFAPAYQAACKQISDRFAPLVLQEYNALDYAKGVADRAAISKALR
jgi:hypothetical protein